MNYFQYRLLTLFVLLTCCLVQVSGADKTHSERDSVLSVDGPYLFRTAEGGIRSIAVSPDGRIQDKTYKKVPADFTFQVYSDEGEKLFPVTLHSAVRPQWNSKQSEKVMVISDPHANWDCFSSILRAGKVINAEYQWVFGDNELVIIGDVFDRGKDVLPIYWLIYKLEKEAEDAGGKVTFLLGNHESMVLGGDLRYVKSKYLQLADSLHMPYKEMWNEQTELGHWLSTRNTMHVIGDNLFVHAGLSQEFLNKNKRIPEVNEIVSKGLFLTKEERKMASEDIAFMYATYGPIWYRGMVHSADKYHPLQREELQKILDAYNVQRVIVGHTIFDDITTFYGHRVIAVNVDNKENKEKARGRGILLENGKISILYDSGKQEELTD